MFKKQVQRSGEKQTKQHGENAPIVKDALERAEAEYKRREEDCAEENKRAQARNN